MLQLRFLRGRKNRPSVGGRSGGDVDGPHCNAMETSWRQALRRNGSREHAAWLLWSYGALWWQPSRHGSVGWGLQPLWRKGALGGQALGHDGAVGWRLQTVQCKGALGREALGCNGTVWWPLQALWREGALGWQVRAKGTLGAGCTDGAHQGVIPIKDEQCPSTFPAVTGHGDGKTVPNKNSARAGQRREVRCN